MYFTSFSPQKLFQITLQNCVSNKIQAQLHFTISRGDYFGDHLKEEGAHSSDWITLNVAE